MPVREYALFIPVGYRLDLLAMVTASMSTHFPNRPRYTMQCSAADFQSNRLRPTYAVYSPSNPNDPVPSQFLAKGCRASSSEGIRLRCTSRRCKLRVTPLDSTAELPICHEINEDDLEHLDNVFPHFEEDDDNDVHDPHDSAHSILNESDDKPLITQLWTHAMPKAWYKTLLNQVLKLP